jgi:hypothetical protein
MPESDTAVGGEPGVAGIRTAAVHAFPRGEHFIAIDRRRRAAVREDRVDAAHGGRVYWERGRLARSAWQDLGACKSGEKPRSQAQRVPLIVATAGASTRMETLLAAIASPVLPCGCTQTTTV